MVFLGVYVLANRFSLEENLQAIRSVADNELHQLATLSARAIDSELASLSSSTDLFRKQTALAFATEFDASEAERARYAYVHDGVSYATVREGGAAAFYTGIVPVGEAERAKAVRSSQLDPLMRNIKDSFPTVTQIYLNTADGLNRIYPYFDVVPQYPPKMDLASYNFYFEADAAHNPERKVVWTEAYVDPAGQGWMTSAVAPAYRGDTLEAVVGFDITVSTIAERLTALEVPWGGYAI
ncbi:MAG: ATPase, partial [Myxococcota bacterium]